MEEDVGIWLLTMQRSQKVKSMHHEYFTHTLKFYNNMWDKDYFSISVSDFYKQLKPNIQNELLDHLFDSVYKEFDDSFFNGLEISFKREIVKRMRFQHFENFPLYDEKYVKDRHSIPCQQPRLILKRGCTPIAVFFITKGEVYASNSTGKYCYFKFKEKTQFGETHLITNSPYGYNIFYEENKSFSALVVPANEFIEVWKNYPNSFKVIKERALK